MKQQAAVMSKFKREGGIYDRELSMDDIHARTTRPMLSRVGGKSKIAGEIAEKIPDHKTYCEPFIGGGVGVF